MIINNHYSKIVKDGRTIMTIQYHQADGDHDHHYERLKERQARTREIPLRTDHHRKHEDTMKTMMMVKLILTG